VHNNLFYPMLRRFATEGLVTKEEVAGQRGQTRQLYALSPLGRKTLIERPSQFGEQRSGSFPNFITLVGMFEILGPGDPRIHPETAGKLLVAPAQQFATLQENMKLGRYSGDVVGFLPSQIESRLT
jgi:hypothetical protein